jgi:hypothetical protein
MTEHAKSLNIALKEWAIVCQALQHGRQIVLLRKGGIYEAAGEFELEHPRFLLFPTYLHQKVEMLKPSDREGLDLRQQEPTQIRISGLGEVTDILQITSRKQIDAIDSEHIWTEPLIEMRFNYRPENPLYLLLVRAFELPAPRIIENTPAYAGCKSWVPLEENISIEGAKPVLSDIEFANRKDGIIQRIRADA